MPNKVWLVFLERRVIRLWYIAFSDEEVIRYLTKDVRKSVVYCVMPIATSSLYNVNVSKLEDIMLTGGK